MRVVFERALVPEGWRANVAVDIDSHGTITAVAGDSELTPAGGTPVPGVAVPGVANLHSHAFQRAMAGTAEVRGRPDDSFWTWREAMYRVAGRVEPDDLAAIAAFAYGRMLRAGYTAVGEFHYLHHDRDGRPYSDPAEMSRRIAAVADEVGIGLCHLPTLYSFGGFSGAPAGAEQRRFVCDTDFFVELLQQLHSHLTGRRNARLGVAFHSLRAVDRDQLDRVAVELDRLDATAPIHIHIAEQQREVADARSALGARPVQWLLDNASVDARWCLVHATHLDDIELRRLAGSGAVAGICPTTEANLGDGLFPAGRYLELGGVFGVGSDSHVTLSPAGELRLLEYGQRLRAQRRALLCTDDTPSVGRSLFERAAAGGAQALGLPGGAIAPGHRADIAVLDRDHPTLWEAEGDDIIDRWLFADVGNPVRDVMVGGAWSVRDGRLVGIDEAAIERDYRATLRRLAG